MYPTRELNDLARRKAELRQRIGVTRLQCVALAAQAARPVHWIDRFLTQWRRISPWAKLGIAPLLLLLGRRRGPRLKASRGLLGWLPLVLRGLRLFRGRGAGAGLW